MSSDTQQYHSLLKSELIDDNTDGNTTDVSFPDEDFSARVFRRKDQISTRRKLLSLASIVLVCNVLGSLFVWSVQKGLDNLPDLKGAKLEKLLYLPPEARNFTPDPLLSLPATIESNAAWEALLGPSMGFIAIEKPSHYGIRPGLPYPAEPSKNVYGLSMFHQLHCLIMIRSRYYDLLTGRMTPADFQFVTGLGGDGVDVPTTSELNHGAQHIDHCFDYLQSGIRCAGQMDLEYAVQRGTSGFLAGEHQCRSWDAAMGIMEKLAFDTTQDPTEFVLEASKHTGHDHDGH